MNESTSHGTSPSLTEADRAALDSLVVALDATSRGIAALEGLKAQLLNAALALGLERVDASRGDGDLPIREIAAEIGAALRVSDRTVQRRLGQARELAESFRATHDALSAGRIGMAQASVILDAGARIDDDDLRAQFEELVLPVAERETASRLKAHARMVAEKLLPRSIDKRHEAAVSFRRVHIDDLDDGMSELTLRAPSTLAHGIHDRLTQQARAVLAADPAETRTMDQLRSDLLCDLALTGAPASHAPTELLGALRAEVTVTVPALTLAGADDAPALLDGVQPVDTAAAIQLVGASPGWDRILTHPVTGAVLAVDRYRPSSELRRFLRAVDQRCRFPGCMMPVRRCDVDHLHDAAWGGATEASNLTDLCRRHHVLKHRSAWTPMKDAEGAITWTSPTGRQYPDRVMPRVAFRVDADPPPF